MEKKKIDRVVEAFRHYIQLKEEGIVVSSNNVGGGQIAGTPQADPGNPPVFRKRKNNKTDLRTQPPIYRRWTRSIEK